MCIRDSFSVAVADVLQNLYQTNPGDTLVSGYGTLTFDVSALFAAHAGETLRLRFAETDNVNFFQLGVDDVRIDVVPEPASTLLFGAALAALLAIGFGSRSRSVACLVLFGATIAHSLPARADTTPLVMLDPGLQVKLLKLRRAVERLLPQVVCPLLIIHSTLDRSIHPDSARLTYELARTPAANKQLVTLHNSGHNLGVDSEWEFVAESTLQFIRQAPRRPAGTPMAENVGQIA